MAVESFDDPKTVEEKLTEQGLHIQTLQKLVMAQDRKIIAQEARISEIQAEAASEAKGLRGRIDELEKSLAKFEKSESATAMASLSGFTLLSSTLVTPLSPSISVPSTSASQAMELFGYGVEDCPCRKRWTQNGLQSRIHTENWKWHVLNC